MQGLELFALAAQFGVGVVVLDVIPLVASMSGLGYYTQYLGDAMLV